MQNLSTPKTFTVKAAATYLGIPRSSFYGLKNKGKGPLLRDLGGRPRYVLEDLDEWRASLPVRVG